MQLHVHHNGQQSGPFSLEEVRSKLADGTLQATDLSWHEGAADWQPLASIQELAESFPPPPAVKTSGLSIASLILGIVSLITCVFGVLTAIPAVICGHISLSRIKKSGGALSGSGMAIAGLVMGYLVIAMIPILAALAVPAMVAARDKAQAMQSMNNARQIHMACMQYAMDNDGKFPQNLDQLVPSYLPNRRLFVCPLSGNKTSTGYEYFGGKESDPADKILLQSKATTKRHERVIVRVDGSAQLKREK